MPIDKANALRYSRSVVPLTAIQTDTARSPLEGTVFLSGPAGTGKTSVGVERLTYLIEQGLRADTLLVMTPQRTLQAPYLNALQIPDASPGGSVTLVTIGGLARRMVDLFWPLVAETAGFAHPDQPPMFLNLESAQYYMAHLVSPLLDQGFFDSLTIDRNRLYSQILDNLNKSGAIGFPISEIGARLDSAWFGEPAQRRVYADAQECALRFREYCLAHNLLDFSLQLELFWDHLWTETHVRQHLRQSYRHLIYDNLEEDIPRSHDLIHDWLPEFDSALLIYDEGGGFRRFLGADPQTGWALRDQCTQHTELRETFVCSPAILALDRSLEAAIQTDGTPTQVDNEMRSAVELLARPTKNDELPRFYPELLEALCSQVARLIQEGLPPNEIVILAPYLSDALRFSLANRLKGYGVPWSSHRPSRSLRDEPASQALLTLAQIAHPHWHFQPPKFDLAYTLVQAIDGMDLVRAQLLTEIVYRAKDLTLAAFDGILPDVQERITYTLGNRYALLRAWLLAYRDGDPLPLDHFLRKLFGEVLSQPGFGFHSNLDAIRVAGNLVESIKKFRLVTEGTFISEGVDIGREYMEMLRDGVISAQYLELQRADREPSVLIAPAYSFLMMNHPVSVQFWLDAGSSGWYERLAQPLTQPYVLSREWENGQLWTDTHEVNQNQESLARLVSGLLHRCKDRIYLGISELGESGFEQRGELLNAFQAIFTEAAR